MTQKEQYVTERAQSICETENISIIESTKIAAQEWEWKKLAKKEGKEIAYFFKIKGVTCQNCTSRKEKYKTVPDECKECGFLNQRNGPYYVVIPCYKETEV